MHMERDALGDVICIFAAGVWHNLNHGTIKEVDYVCGQDT